tara:strand:+ start:353 stop:559 length:207 start_codon:yes stop_codon:yes gene_type:complete
MIIFFCSTCGQRGEFETKKEMKCDCGNYVKDHDKASNHVNMRKTWSGTTKVEFNQTTIEQDIADRNKH